MIAGYGQRALKEILLYKAQAPKHRIKVSKNYKSPNGSNRKATFPDPVMALPHISRPVNANGIQAA
jgi:hypothetical protein